jgi:hypothetical protein
MAKNKKTARLEGIIDDIRWPVDADDVAPILTADGVEMHKGMEVFLPVTQYTRTELQKSTIVALSRINRYFIMRCAKGCETKVKLTDGCGYGDYGQIPYACVVNAGNKVKAILERDVKNKRKLALKLMAEASAIEAKVANFDIEVV